MSDTPTRGRLQGLLQVLDRPGPLVILPHDNPDPDALAAAATLRYLAHSLLDQDEVAREKEAKSKESNGFWGWVKSKAKALVDGLKQAVNFIYDNLRKAVKALFEAAKRLALAAIDLARKAIVGLIKAYGAILKGLVRIALAAFPEIRDRILERIDQAVNAATELVNKAAEMLKKGVSAILDFLASTIDKILGLVQDIYNAVFTIIGMIISGELKELFERRHVHPGTLLITTC